MKPVMRNSERKTAIEKGEELALKMRAQKKTALLAASRENKFKPAPEKTSKSKDK